MRQCADLGGVKQRIVYNIQKRNLPGPCGSRASAEMTRDWQEPPGLIPGRGTWVQERQRIAERIGESFIRLSPSTDSAADPRVVCSRICNATFLVDWIADFLFLIELSRKTGNKSVLIRAGFIIPPSQGNVSVQSSPSAWSYIPLRILHAQKYKVKSAEFLACVDLSGG